MTKRLTAVLVFGLVVFAFCLPGCGDDTVNTKSQTGIAAPKDGPKVLNAPGLDTKKKGGATVGGLDLPSPPKDFKKP